MKTRRQENKTNVLLAGVNTSAVDTIVSYSRIPGRLVLTNVF